MSKPIKNTLLTKELAISEHRKMWNWLADRQEEHSFVIVDKSEYFETDLPAINYLHNDCFCCEYGRRRRGDYNMCDSCPIDWGEDLHCYESKGLYTKWVAETKDMTLRASYARQIANLPESYL